MWRIWRLYDVGHTEAVRNACLCFNSQKRTFVSELYLIYTNKYMYQSEIQTEYLTFSAEERPVLVSIGNTSAIAPE